MNSAEVLNVLRAAIDPEGDKRVSLQYRELASAEAEREIARDLAPPVTEVLRQQQEYLRNPVMALRHYAGASSLDPPRAAEFLIIRAIRDGADVAVDWLADLLHRPHASGMRIMPLWLLVVEAALRLTPNINLIPISDLPQNERSWLTTPNPMLSQLTQSRFSMRFQPPSAALTEQVIISPLFAKAGEFQSANQNGDLLDEARLCLSAISPNPVLGPISWFRFEDPDLNALASGGISASSLEIVPDWFPAPTSLDTNAAQQLVPQYFALTGRSRDIARISLERLVQAMLRRELGDKAADLSIALKALLGGGRGEHTWKVSTRAAVLTSWDLRTMLDRRSIISAVYDMRSSLVHSGSASDKVRVSGRGQQPATFVCEEATRICAAVIRAIIERGGIPEWAAFDVSGGLCGWPPGPALKRKRS